MTGPLLRSCCFILTVFNPAANAATLLTFFEKREIAVNTFFLQTIDTGKADMYFHVSISKDRIKYVSQLFQKMEIVDHIQVLEGREAS